jgi:formylglycine-generating enzyme required for sulfatase activity
MNNQNDYYQILGIPPNAKIDIIKKAYREKALRYHPDRGGTHEQMLLINEAWAILSDPARRKLYDNAQTNRTDEAVQKEASVDREFARRDASDYPRSWSNFQEWMGAAFDRVESTKLGLGLVIPNPKKDIIGWIFVIIGGFFAVYLTALMGFTRTGNFFLILRFIIFSVGGWLGWLVYQFFIDFFVNNSDKTPPGRKKYTYKNTNGEKEYTCPIFNARFVLIPAGTFMMGSPPDKLKRVYDQTLHQVTISKPFYMQTTEVTQGQWKKVMGENPSRFKGNDNLPVEQVSWNDVQDFIGRLNRQERTVKYRLPTEAEWEYACRAGSTTAYCFGDNPGDLGEYTWYKDNSEDRTHPVGQKKPNAWGLYDMHGNVCEWVKDWYGDYPLGSVTDPEGPSSGSHRVYRGGSYTYYDRACLSSLRSRYDLGIRPSHLGFRLLRIL